MKARFGLWIAVAAAALYVVSLGAHWLALNLSDKELAASASRVWDVQRELAAHHGVPWWTPYFMSGSSYGLNYSRGFYLVPWLLFATFTDLITAGKLVALAAIFASTVTMYFCGRHFLKNEWAAVLAAMAFMLHPEQIIRAAGAEQITISLSFLFIPLLWWTLARALESNTFRDASLCALVAVLAWWADNKQAFIHFVFLFSYALYWLWPRRKQWRPTARTCGLLAGVGLALGAWVLAPGIVESKYVKLFIGDPLTEWQKTYSFKSLLGLVDRDGEATSNAVEAVLARVQANGGRVRSQVELEQVRRVFSLKADSPEKYMGLVLLAVVAVTVLWNRQRVNRRSFWFFVAALLASVMFATGLSSVWSANWTTWEALSSQGQSGVPVSGLLVCAAFLVLFYRRKLTTTRKKVVAGIVLAIVLFVPGFKILAALPYFKEIRAPFVFYDGPAMFWGAMLIGFFVTDVLKSRAPLAVAGITVLLLIDYWPYQKPTRDNGVPASTTKNLEAAYGALKSDKDWVKTYSISGRYFHLLGPMYSGKPQAYEAFYNWQAPLGLGLLQGAGSGSRELLNLLGVRYVVFDKSDPDMQAPQLQQVLAAYRQAFPVAHEDDDFAVFRNDTAHAYVTAYARACVFDGDVRNSPQLALALAARHWPLVHGANIHGKYEQVYRDGQVVTLPVHEGEVVPLADVRLIRDNAQRVRIHLSAPRDCLAVIAESYYPYWCAEVDGQPAEVLHISCGLMGLELPAGSHTVVLRYQPPRTYAIAGALSLATLIIGAGVVIGVSRRGHR